MIVCLVMASLFSCHTKQNKEVRLSGRYQGLVRCLQCKGLLETLSFSEDGTVTMYTGDLDEVVEDSFFLQKGEYVVRDNMILVAIRHDTIYYRIDSPRQIMRVFRTRRDSKTFVDDFTLTKVDRLGFSE